MPISRRQWMRYAMGWSLLGASASGWGPLVAQAMARQSSRRRGVLLWMAGGPSQTDTFDLKPQGSAGEFKAIDTHTPGVQISEHLPQLAQWSQELAIVRSMSTVEGDHGRGTFLMRTGYRPTGPLRYPPVGAALAKQLAREEDLLPSYVSIAPYEAINRAAFGSGFLGPRYSPLLVRGQPPEGEAGRATLTVDDLGWTGHGDASDPRERMKLWEQAQGALLADHPQAAMHTHDTLVRRAFRLLANDAAEAFALDDEPDAVRDAYGRGVFGQGCLLARRLLERGVSFVEVTLGSFADGAFGWDTHMQNFPTVRRLSGELDAGWSTLMSELSDRGLLDSTTLLWSGEFGRTPIVNMSAGRDHYPQAWTSVLAGGGIRGGQVYGRTSDDGRAVTDGPMSAGDLLATFCRALGVDPATENITDVGRPIQLAEGHPVDALLAV